MPSAIEPASFGNEDPPTGNWQMGLKGIVALIANCTAIGLICIMFYQDRHESLKQAREDRQIFRDELSIQRAANQKAADQISLAVNELTNELRKRQK